MKKPCIDFYELYLKNKNKFINPDYKNLINIENNNNIHNFGIDGFIKKLK